MVSAATQQTARPVTPLGILVQQLQQLSSAASRETASAEFQADLKAACQLAAGLDPYLERCTTPESAALANLSSRTQAENWGRRFEAGETERALEQEMLSGHLEGQLLKMLVSISRAQRVLEIGMFSGYSALAIAEALPENGTLVACEVDEYASQFATECFSASPHAGKIQVKVAPAIETLRQLIEAKVSFDLAFIDADKGSYIDYCNLLIGTDLLSPNGFICVDNTLMQGQPYLSEYEQYEQTENGRAIAHFNQFVIDDDRVEQVMLPVRDGFTIIKRK